MVSGDVAPATSPGACEVRLQCLERAGEGGGGGLLGFLFEFRDCWPKTLNSQMRDLDFEEPVKNSALSFGIYWLSTF